LVTPAGFIIPRQFAVSISGPHLRHVMVSAAHDE
jgi:hypothetical protein